MRFARKVILPEGDTFEVRLKLLEFAMLIIVQLRREVAWLRSSTDGYASSKVAHLTSLTLL